MLLCSLCLLLRVVEGVSWACCLRCRLMSNSGWLPKASTLCSALHATPIDWCTRDTVETAVPCSQTPAAVLGAEVLVVVLHATSTKLSHSDHTYANTVRRGSRRSTISFSTFVSIPERSLTFVTYAVPSSCRLVISSVIKSSTTWILARLNKWTHSRWISQTRQFYY